MRRGLERRAARGTAGPSRWRAPAALLLALLAGCGTEIAPAVEATSAAATTRHFAPNHNFGADGVWRPAAAGFDLADVSDPRQLEALPAGVQGLVWVGRCAGADPAFVAALTPFVHAQNVFGFYLMDDPDPRIGHARCTPEALRAEADWIHEHVPGAVTFIVLMNLANSHRPSFRGTYNPENSHVDLYGVDPYPCRSELERCSETMIERYVAAAEAWGIPRGRLVPVYQAFGGGRWSDGDGGSYRLPTAAEVRAILARWRALVPAPVFDYAYSWGVQRGDHALEDTPGLWPVFAEHNQGR